MLKCCQSVSQLSTAYWTLSQLLLHFLRLLDTFSYSLSFYYTFSIIAHFLSQLRGSGQACLGGRGRVQAGAGGCGRAQAGAGERGQVCSYERRHACAGMHGCVLACVVCKSLWTLLCVGGSGFVVGMPGHSFQSYHFHGVLCFKHTS